jgi:hypothetical protein
MTVRAVSVNGLPRLNGRLRAKAWNQGAGATVLANDC